MAQMIDTLAFHHAHLDRFRINFTGLTGTFVRHRVAEGGEYYRVIGTRTVYDHEEEVYLLDFADKADADAVSDAFDTIIHTLLRTDPEFVRTCEDPDAEMRKAVREAHGW